VQVCGEGLGLNFGLEKGVTSGFLPFDSPEGSFQAFGELLTRLSCHPFDPLLDPTVRSDGEAERALGHAKGVLRHEC
jgi:hypothetical protein